MTKQWCTLPAPAADISSIVYENTVVSADNVVGSVGGGMRLVMHRMARVRAGISALAAGTTHEAVCVTEDYLHTRQIHKLVYVACEEPGNPMRLCGMLI